MKGDHGVELGGGKIDLTHVRHLEPGGRDVAAGYCHHFGGQIHP
jgi:hypothetical protein